MFAVVLLKEVKGILSFWNFETHGSDEGGSRVPPNRPCLAHLSRDGLHVATAILVGHPYRLETLSEAPLGVLLVGLDRFASKLCSTLNFLLDGALKLEVHFQIVLRVPVWLLLAPLLELVNFAQGLGTFRVLDLLPVCAL